MAIRSEGKTCADLARKKRPQEAPSRYGPGQRPREIHQPKAVAEAGYGTHRLSSAPPQTAENTCANRLRGHLQYTGAARSRGVGGFRKWTPGQELVQAIPNKAQKRTRRSGD